jgi:hypothetical protein
MYIQAVDEFEKTHLVTCKISEFFANLFVAKQEGCTGESYPVAGL